MFPSTYYEHSGKAPLGGMLLTLVGGGVAGTVLGAVYGLLIYYIPFVYINAIITFVFGGALAMIVGTCAKVGKIRNAGAVTAIALVVALVAYFAHWVVWVERMSGTQLLDPGQIWAFASTLNVLGPWSIFGWTPTGFALWAIWGIEALVIVGMGALGAHGVIDVPFCENTGQWTTETVMPKHFQPITDAQSLDSVQSVLHTLQPANDDVAEYTEVSLATADGSELRCVSLNQVTVEVDKDGKPDEKKTTIVKHMLLDRSSFDQLQRLGESAAA